MRKSPTPEHVCKESAHVTYLANTNSLRRPPRLRCPPTIPQSYSQWRSSSPQGFCQGRRKVCGAKPAQEGEGRKGLRPERGVNCACTSCKAMQVSLSSEGLRAAATGTSGTEPWGANPMWATDPKPQQPHGTPLHILGDSCFSHCCVFLKPSPPPPPPRGDSRYYSLSDSRHLSTAQP